MKSFNEWLFSKKVKTKTDEAGWVRPEDITRIAKGVMFQQRKELDEFGHLDDRNKKRVRELLDNMGKPRAIRVPGIEPTPQKEREPSFYDKQQQRILDAERRAYNNPPSAQSGFPSYSGPG
jgi:hypothetical protein